MIDIHKITRRDAIKLLGSLVASTAAVQAREQWIPLFGNLARIDKNYLWWEPVCAELCVKSRHVENLELGDFVTLFDSERMILTIPCEIFAITINPSEGTTTLILRSVHAF